MLFNPSSILSQENAFDRPDPKGIPTKVYIGMYVIDISQISDVDQSFTVDFHVMAKWKDPRLAVKNSKSSIARKVPLESIWNPDVRLYNLRNINKLYKDIVEIRSDGTVIYRQRGYGNFSMPMKLKNFPFDKQILPIELFSRFGPEDISFIINLFKFLCLSI